MNPWAPLAMSICAAGCAASQPAIGSAPRSGSAHGDSPTITLEGGREIDRATFTREVERLRPRLRDCATGVGGVMIARLSVRDGIPSVVFEGPDTVLVSRECISAVIRDIRVGNEPTPEGTGVLLRLEW